MKSIAKENNLLLLFLLFVAVILFFNLGGWGLTETSEARYAEISREMFLSKDYLNPQFLGIFHYHKPPLAYYITCLGYTIFGINELGARFFLQIGVLFQLLFIYKIAIYFYNNKKIALLCAMCYFTMPIVIMACRNVTTDIYLTTFIMAAIYFWLSYVKENKSVFNLYGYYLCIGVALETKGPVALLFIWSFVIAYRIFFKTKLRFSIHYVLGGILMLVVGTLWYVLVIIEKPALINYFVFKQTVSRIASESFHRGQPFWFYIPITLGVLFPYVIGLLIKGKYLFKSNKTDRLLLINIGVVIVLFSLFETKRIFYILPLFWMFTMLIVRALQYAKPQVLKSIQISYLVLIGVYVGACVVLYFVSIGTIVITATQLILGLVLAIATFVIYFRYGKNKDWWCYILGVSFFTLLLTTGSVFMNNNRNLVNSFKPIVQFIEEDSNRADKKIMVFDFMVTSIPFYTTADYYIINYLHDTVTRDVQFQENENWKEHHVNVYLKSEATRFKQLLSTGKNYVLVNKKWGVYPQFNFIKEQLPYQKDFGKWILYYN